MSDNKSEMVRACVQELVAGNTITLLTPSKDFEDAWRRRLRRAGVSAKLMRNVIFVVPPSEGGGNG